MVAVHPLISDIGLDDQFIEFFELPLDFGAIPEILLLVVKDLGKVRLELPNLYEDEIEIIPNAVSGRLELICDIGHARSGVKQILFELPASEQCAEL